MALLPRNVTDKTQDEMLPLLSPARYLIFLLNRRPVVDALLRLQFRPGNVHIQKLNVVRYLFSPRGRCIAHQRIAEYLL